MSRFRSVRYHSSEWAELVEQGWVTMYVDTMPDGQRYASMILEPKR